MKGFRRTLCAAAAIVLLCSATLGTSSTVWADQIKNADVFADASWNYMTEWTVEGEKDWLQSMCETGRYIVCYQDSKVIDQPDVITVFDRETREFLFEVKEMDYEHGNGMTFNPYTNEVYIAPYNTQIKENKGCIFALDADTLTFKRRIQISDGSYNVSGIEYVDGSNQYIIQTTREENYTFMVLDSDFNYVDTLFEGDRSLESNLFQDFCVSGDFIISVPWMKNSMDDPRVQLYSISQKAYLGSYSVYAPGAGEIYEPESICQSDAGEIIIAIALSGTKRMALYNTYVPVVYTVETAVENGEITPTTGDVDMGSDYKVEYSCTEDYELTQLQVDGVDLDPKENKNGYTFGNIQDDHYLFAGFTEIPKFDITTAVKNGTIDDSQLIRRDENVTIHYTPELHYEMDQILIDGAAVDSAGLEEAYTFDNIQGPHSIDVSFKEIPSFPVTTEVMNGTITATNNKIYRDENYTVEYQPKQDYALAYMSVDGEWVQQISDSQSDSYTFENMQKGHEVRVIYQWKYLPYAMLGGAFAVCIPMGMIYIVIARIRKKRKRMTRENRFTE